MKHILLLEDDILQIKQLKRIIRNYSNNFQVTCTSNIAQAMEILEENTCFDAFFLDVSLNNEVPDHAGMDFATILSRMPRYQKTPVLFITALPEYVYPAVNELHCYAYIIKPYDEKQIHRQLNSLFQKNRLLVLKTIDNIHVRLEYDSIRYIQSNRRYLTYYTTNGNFTSRQYTMQKLCELLSHDFVRCHKSYIVNLAYVHNFDFSNCYAQLESCSENIPLSRNFKL